jgi:hypothetical protein
MITKDTALNIFTKKLNEMSIVAGVELALMNIREEDFGWIFLYQAKSYVETGDTTGVIVGNAPIIIDKLDGSVHITGTAYPLKHYIEEYRREQKNARE